MSQIAEGMILPLQIAPLVVVIYSIYIYRISDSKPSSVSSPEDVDLDYQVMDFKMLFIQIAIAILKYLLFAPERIIAIKKDTSVNVIENNDDITIRVDMPGYPKNKIKVLVQEYTLNIKASHGTRKLSKDISLPSRVDPNSATITYENGVLEVKVKYNNDDGCVLITV